MVKGGSWPGSYVCKYPDNWYYKGRVMDTDDEEFYIELSAIGKKLYEAAFTAHLCESIETPEELDWFMEKMQVLKGLAMEYYNFVDKNATAIYNASPVLLNASHDIIQLIDSVQINLLPYRYAVIHEIEERMRFFKYFIIEGTFVVGPDNHGVMLDLCDLHYEWQTDIGAFV